jgi:hypothetical protein
VWPIRETKWSTKVIQFGGVKGFVVVVGEVVDGKEGGGFVIAVVFVVVNGHVRTPFDDEAGVL